VVAANNSQAQNIHLKNGRIGQYVVITPAVSIDRSHQKMSRKKNNFTTTALLSTTTTTNSDTKTWQWCSLWCSAIKCFNANSNASTHAGRVYQQNDNHFIQIDLPRKYRDKNCNITYEL